MLEKIGRAFSVTAGEGMLASRKLVPRLTPTLSVTSPAFSDGGRLPLSATAQGDGVPPVLVVSRVPAAARALVVVCEDPDVALPEPYVHWLVYRLEGEDMTIDATRLRTASEGKNSRLETGWAAPNPRGHGVHHYHFQVFALDQPLAGNPDEDSMSLPPYQPPDGVLAGAGRTELLEEIRGHVIAWGEAVASFQRG